MRARSVTTSARAAPAMSAKNISPPTRVRRLTFLILCYDSNDKACVSTPVEPIIRHPMVHLLHSAAVATKSLLQYLFVIARRAQRAVAIQLDCFVVRRRPDSSR